MDIQDLEYDVVAIAYYPAHRSNLPLLTEDDLIELDNINQIRELALDLNEPDIHVASCT